MTIVPGDKGASRDAGAEDDEDLLEDSAALGEDEEEAFAPEGDVDLGIGFDDEADGLNADDLEPGLDDPDLGAVPSSDEGDWTEGTEPDESLPWPDDDLLGDDEEDDLVDGSEPETDEGFGAALESLPPAFEGDDGDEGFEDEGEGGAEDLTEPLPPLRDEPGDGVQEEGPEEEGAEGEELLVHGAQRESPFD